MENIDYSKLGKRVRYYRKIRSLTQEELAVSIDLTQKYISNIECAHSIPTLQTFVKICNALHVAPNLLLMDNITFSYRGQNEEIVSLLKDCSEEQIREIQKYVFYILQK